MLIAFRHAALALVSSASLLGLNSQEFKEYTIEMEFVFYKESGDVLADGRFIRSRAKNGDHVHFMQERDFIGKFDPVHEVIEPDKSRITTTDPLQKKSAGRKMSPFESSMRKSKITNCVEAGSAQGGVLIACDPDQEIAGYQTHRVEVDRAGMRLIAWLAPSLDWAKLKEQTFNPEGKLMADYRLIRVSREKLPEHYWKYYKATYDTEGNDLHELIRQSEILRRSGARP
jgi:hypothetical protein